MNNIKVKNMSQSFIVFVSLLVNKLTVRRSFQVKVILYSIYVQYIKRNYNTFIFYDEKITYNFSKKKISVILVIHKCDGVRNKKKSPVIWFLDIATKCRQPKIIWGQLHKTITVGLNPKKVQFREAAHCLMIQMWVHNFCFKWIVPK